MKSQARKFATRRSFVRQLGFETFEGRILLAAGGGGGWNDSCQVVLNIDFSFDGKVSAIDVLIPINYINLYGGFTHLKPLSGDPMQLVDPNGDGWLTSADVLQVVNYLNWYGPGPLISECVNTVFEQYVDGDQITIAPGQTDVLVASVIFTARYDNPNPVFLSQISAIGNSDFFRLRDTEGHWIGVAWHGYNNMGIQPVQLDPGASIQLNLFADIPKDASGIMYFGLGSPQYQAFAGETVQTVVLNDNYVSVQDPSLTVTMTSTPETQVVAQGQDITICDLEFKATGLGYTVTEAKFTVPVGSMMVIASASLLDNGKVLATAAFVNDQVYFTGLNVVVPAGKSKLLSLYYTLVSMTDEGTSGLNIKPTLYSVKVFDTNGVQSKLFPDLTGNDLFVY